MTCICSLRESLEELSVKSEHLGRKNNMKNMKGKKSLNVKLKIK